MEFTGVQWSPGAVLKSLKIFVSFFRKVDDFFHVRFCEGDGGMEHDDIWKSSAIGKDVLETFEGLRVVADFFQKNRRWLLWSSQFGSQCAR